MSSTRASIIDSLSDTIDGISGLTGGCLRWDRAGVNAVSKPCAIIRWDSDRSEDGPTSRYLTRHLELTVTVFAVPEDDESSDEAAETWIAAVEAAVMDDRTAGGYARDVRLIESVQFPMIEGQPDIGGIVRLDVLYMEALP